MIKKEIKRIVLSKGYIIVAMFFLAMILIDFFVSAQWAYGRNLSEIPSAYQMSILSNKGNIFDLAFGSFIFLLISNFIAMELISEEVEKKIYTYICTRVCFKEYLKVELLAVVVVTFFTVWICLMLSLGLTLIAFPIQGYFTDVTTHNMLMSPDPNRLFGYLHNYYPYLNILLLITIRAGIAAVTTFLSAAILICNSFSKHVAFMVPMVIYIVYSTLTSLASDNIEDIGLYSIVETNILSVNGAGNEIVLFGYLIIQVIIGIMLIKMGLRNNETIL